MKLSKVANRIAAGPRAQRPPRGHSDAVADETHGAIGQADVDTAGVFAARGSIGARLVAGRTSWRPIRPTPCSAGGGIAAITLGNRAGSPDLVLTRRVGCECRGDEASTHVAQRD